MKSWERRKPLFLKMKKVLLRVGETRSFSAGRFHNFVLPGNNGVTGKFQIMLHQISWHAYVVSLLLVLAAYYLYVGLVYFRADLRRLLSRLTGKQPGFNVASGSLIPVPEYQIMGAAQPENGTYALAEELQFAPAEIPDEEAQAAPGTGIATTNESKLIGDFSAMVDEVKTLIRVINESSESHETFEMLFRLIIQKYPELTGTGYEAKVNKFLLTESEGQFPFALSLPELESYWSDHSPQI